MIARTWHAGQRGPYYRRDFIFENERGEVLFKGATFSVVLDFKNRTVFHGKELPFPLGQPYESFAIEASPSFKTSAAFEKVDERKVYSSFIDRLGHVNNCRYSEFAYDALTDVEREGLINLRRMDIYFKSELREHDTFSVLKAAENGKILVQGYNNTKNEVAFYVVMRF
jgi:acyl-ACP thioesterase